MKTNSRTYNSTRNLVYGIITQCLTFLVSFILRTIFIATLGKDLLGVNGLYSNILTLLSLAELGLATVMLYSLYKPIKENNVEQIKSLLQYFRKLYNKIGILILIFGLFLVPFLNIFINSELSLNSLKVYYVLFLLNTVFSYVCIYKTALINADQRFYLIKNNNLVFTLIKTFIQIIILLVYKNYFLYLFIEIIGTLSNNLFLGKVCDKYYPYIKEPAQDLDKESKQEILTNLKSMSLYKIGVVIMNNTDNILISKIVGTVWVGLYSNYGLFISAVNTFINTFISSILSSVGNLNSETDKDKQYQIFNMLLLIFHWVTAICSLCFISVFNDVILLWIGPDYLLDTMTIGIIIFNFYLSNIINPVWIYRETSGLFNKIKYIMLISAFINIVLSVILGLEFGIFGILLATAVSRLVTTVWYEPIVLFKERFKKSPKNYYLKQLKYFLVTCLSLGIVLTINASFSSVSLINIFIKLTVSVLIPNLMFYIFCGKQEEFISFSSNYLLKLIKR